MPAAKTLRAAVDDYILYHDLAPGTRAWYRRIVGVFCQWAGPAVTVDQFNGEQISRLLAEKGAAGRSPHYIKSLRNGLVAILRNIRGDEPIERIRGVRTPPLEPEAWTPGEVSRLLAACQTIPEAGRWRWLLVVALGYYTGFDRCDIERIERKHIQGDGMLFFHRRKTGSPVLVGIPADVLELIDAHCPGKGPILRMGFSPEWFRRIFAGIVDRAGLSGTFKKLRKSSGSAVELLTPGKGHKHLGNTRAIFERHYESHRITRANPTMPPAVRLPPFSSPAP